jgi:hypothetical protein
VKGAQQQQQLVPGVMQAAAVFPAHSAQSAAELPGISGLLPQQLLQFRR